MGYVDLQRRQAGHRLSPRAHAELRGGSVPGPSLRRVATAFGPLILLFLLLSVGPLFIGPPSAELLLALAAVAVILPVLLLLPRVGAPSQRRTPSQPGPGVEKQLLLVLRDLGGLTPVEAALETSLTVDEADGILTHLAERGHLGVESRDGVLRYTLPGRRPATGSRTV